MITRDEAMKPRERIRFIATIDAPKRVAKEYQGKTIENIIQQMEARRKEVYNEQS